MSRFRPFYVRHLSVLAVLTLLTLAAQAAPPPDEPIVGIKFFTGTWQQVLAEAKKQNKPVFVDIYTTWCGPCKLMARQAFPDKAVGDLMNAHFISYQIDAEKGEGIAVAKKYAVTAYPTSLFLSADGALIQRTVGYGGISSFLAEVNKAVEAVKDPKPIAVWDKEFTDGQRDTEFLRTYLSKRAKLGLPNAEALEAYLKTAPEAELNSLEGIEAMSGNLTTSQSKAFDRLIDAVKAIRMDPSKRQSLTVAMRALNQALSWDERQAKTEAELQTAIDNRARLTDLLGGKKTAGSAAADALWMNFYQRTKNVPKYREYAMKAALELMNISADSLKAKDKAAYQSFLAQTKAMPDSLKTTAQFINADKQMQSAESRQVANKLNTLAWGYFQTLTSPADLQQALTWSGRSLELSRAAAYLDTYAQLLGKLGRKAEAVRYEEEALALAKTQGEATADYEKALVELKK